MKSFRLRGCKNCGGDLYFDEEDNVWKCLQCEHPAKGIMAEKTTVATVEKTAIPDMAGWDNRKKGRFYKEHKGEILADCESLGIGKMLLKWQLSLSGWVGIRRRWGIKPRPRLIKEKGELGQGESPKELEWLRGYHQAVRDILTGGGIDASVIRDSMET